MVAVQCGPVFLEEKIAILTLYYNEDDDYVKVVGISEEQKEWLMLMYSNPYQYALQWYTSEKWKNYHFSMRRDIYNLRKNRDYGKDI